ncbi:hypothetical protein PF008_g24032 [Phytophthora fragariae]|uniref:Uncharacterized protein n=1 Tax=Phytophthora fragariae TaxID=53985 RepID=A0A6G0QP26_9STRA|nr:hypothetical protein PF008_g24032 [Phytophthora fragariae]
MTSDRPDKAAQLLAGSTNASYTLDFRANVLPPPPPPCRTYYDVLTAIQGLTAFTNAERLDCFTHPLDRLREFVAANQGADPANTPEHVRRTLHKDNQHLGAVYMHLASDSPSYWRDFCSADHRIPSASSAWAVVLFDPIATTASSAKATSCENAPRPHGYSNRRVMRDQSDRQGFSRASSNSAHIRALIPRTTDGVEPCLRFFA